MDVELSFFYNVRKTPELARIERVEELGEVPALLAGTPLTYAFPPVVDRTLAVEGRPGTEHEAFQRLHDIDDPAALVPAVSRVGRTIVRDARLWDIREITPEQLGLADEPDRDRSLRMSLHLIASRRNPHNQGLIQAFDRALSSFKEEGQLDAVIELAQAAVPTEGVVRLSAPAGEGEFVSARTITGDTRTLRLPRGTTATVLEWSAAYLGTDPEGSSEADLTQVQILNGPMEGRAVLVEDRFIELP
jgi:hypothetical protein